MTRNEIAAKKAAELARHVAVLPNQQGQPIPMAEPQAERPKETTGSDERSEEQATLPLKYGGRRIPVREALTLLAHLRVLFEQDPADFRALLKLAKCPTATVASASIQNLKEEFFLAEDGSVRSDVRDIILSAYREKVEVLGDPFRAAGEADRETVRRVERDIQRAIGKWLNHIRNEEQGPVS
jgi:hypothetical protein